jgi:Protein of unknown function (DUF2536).
MQFQLDLIENKIELFEASSIKELERQIERQIENNKALMLDVHSVSHSCVFDPRTEKPLYSAVVHFKLKR